MQFLNTRSHKGEKEKQKIPYQDKDSDPEEPSPDANLSLMDRTKHHAKAAREQHRQKTDNLLSVEDEVMDLKEVMLQTRERVKAAKAAKSRAADLRRQLQELQEEEDSLAASNHEVAPTHVPVADPSDTGAFVAASLSLKSAVRLFYLFRLWLWISMSSYSFSALCFITYFDARCFSSLNAVLIALLKSGQMRVSECLIASSLSTFEPP